MVAMQQLGFGRFEALRIAGGKLELNPWPKTVHGVKFASQDTTTLRTLPENFALKQQQAEFFRYVRCTEKGEIGILEIRHGIPFSMEIEICVRMGAKEGGEDA